MNASQPEDVCPLRRDMGVGLPASLAQELNRTEACGQHRSERVDIERVEVEGFVRSVRVCIRMRRGHDVDTIGPEDATDLGEVCGRILEMFDPLETDRRVDRPLCDREPLGVRLHEVTAVTRVPLPCDFDRLGCELDSDRSPYRVG
jgi:hypothetical protein